MRMLWSFLVGLVLVYFGLLAMLYFAQSKLVYFPSRQLVATPAQVGLDFEEVTFLSDEGVTLHGWFVPGEPGGRTLLFMHGNAGNISHRLDSLLVFNQLGLSTFIFDYSGYGSSEGVPSERATYNDAAGAWRYLTTQRGIDPGQIILFGRSMGGAVATWLARKQPSAGLILESTFTSMVDLAARHYPYVPARLLLKIRYDPIAEIPHVDVPVLVAHSPDDEIVPFSHAQAMHSAASEPKHFLTLEGGHNDGFLRTGARYQEGLQAFLSSLPSTSRSDRVQPKLLF